MAPPTCAKLPNRRVSLTTRVAVMLKMPPPLPWAELPDKTLPLTVSVVEPPTLLIAPPLPRSAELPDRVLAYTETDPPNEFQMAPPSKVPARLPERMQPLTVSVPIFQMAPPASARLPDRVLSLTVTVPA